MDARAGFRASGQMPEIRRYSGIRHTRYQPAHRSDYRHHMDRTQSCRSGIRIRIVRHGKRIAHPHHACHADLAAESHAMGDLLVVRSRILHWRTRQLHTLDGAVQRSARSTGLRHTP